MNLARRYIHGTNPLDPSYHRYTDAERAELVARVKSQSNSALYAAANARWEQHRASLPVAGSTEPRYVTSAGRVAARYAMLVGCTLTAAAWDLRDMGVHATPSTVSRRWREIYPGVTAYRQAARGVR